MTPFISTLSKAAIAVGFAAGLSYAAWSDGLYNPGGGGSNVITTTSTASFPVENYGASPTTGIYHAYGDAAITSGTAMLHSASATFTSADVGSPIQVFYGGAATTLAAPAQAVAGVAGTPQVSGSVVCYPRGALAAATYNIRLSYIGSGGETAPGTRFSIACAANTLPMIYSPAQVYGAQAWNAYIGTGTETLQNPYPLQIGQAFWLATPGLISGAAIPSNTTSIVPPLVTTILSVQGANDVTLNANAGTTVSSGNYAYGKAQDAAFTAAFAACTAAGGGTVTIGAQYVINSGNLVVPDKCALSGPNRSFGNQAVHSGTAFPNPSPSIILNPAYTIQLNNASGLSGLGVFEFGIPAVSLTTRIGIDAVSNFTGTGISSNPTVASDGQIQNVFEIGFSNCILDQNSQRWSVSHWWGQCGNGILVEHNHDAPANFFDTEVLGFYGQNLSWKNVTYAISAIANSAGAIQLTIPNSNVLKVGDFVIITGNQSNFPGANNRWTVGAVSSGTITLANSQFAPVTTGTWANGAQTAVLASMNSVSVKQTITGTNIGPGGVNTILGVNYTTNTVMLQYATTAAGAATSVTMGNTTYSGSGSNLVITAGQNNGTAYYVSDGGGVFFEDMNTFGWNSCIWVEQTDTSDKVRNIKFSNTVCDDKVDPTETAFQFDATQTANKPGAVQWVNGGVTDGYGQGFVVDVGATGATYNGGVLQIANTNVASEPSTQMIGTIITGKVQMSGVNATIGGGGLTKNFLQLGQNSQGLFIGDSALSGTYITLDSAAQGNLHYAADSVLGSATFGPSPTVPLTTPILTNISAATPSTSAVNYSSLSSDTAFGNSFNATFTTVRHTWPVAGTMSGLHVEMPGISSGSYTVAVVDNGTITALKCTAAFGTSSCDDTTDNIAITAGHNLGLEFCPLGNSLADCNTAGGGPTIAAGAIRVSLLFASSNTQEGVLLGGLSVNNIVATNALVQYAPLCSIASGFAWAQTSDLTTSCVVPVAGTIDNLNVDLSGSSSPGNYVFVLEKNGADSTVTCTTTSSQACSDTAGCSAGLKTCTHSISVVAGDTISVKTTPNTSPTARAAKVSARWVPNTSGQAILMLVSHAIPNTVAGTKFCPISGASSWTTTEANENEAVPNVGVSMTLGNLWFAESTPPTSTNTRAWVLSDATSLTPLAATITASSTQTIGGVAAQPAAIDTSDFVQVGPQDLVDCNLISTGAQAAITWIKSGMSVTVP